MTIKTPNNFNNQSIVLFLICINAIYYEILKKMQKADRN